MDKETSLANYKIKIGKYKGKPLKDIPIPYLLWMYKLRYYKSDGLTRTRDSWLYHRFRVPPEVKEYVDLLAKKGVIKKEDTTPND